VQRTIHPQILLQIYRIWKPVIALIVAKEDSACKAAEQSFALIISSLNGSSASFAWLEQRGCLILQCCDAQSGIVAFSGDAHIGRG
jgi:hypothetical protein